MATDPIEMIPVYMPDPTALIGPLAEYQFQSATETTYKMVPVNFRKLFDSCGYKSKTDPPTAAEVTQVQDVSSAGTSLFANYGATVSQLKTDWQALLNADVAVLQNVRQSSTISSNCQLAFNSAISELNKSAGTLPSAGQSEDEHIWNFLDAAVAKTTNLVQTAAKAQNDPAASADATTTEIESLQSTAKTQADTIAKQNAEISDMKNEIAAWESGASGPGSTTTTPSTTTTTPTTADTGASGAYQISLGASGATDTSGASGAGTGSGSSSSSYGTGTGGNGSTGTDTGTGTGSGTTDTGAGTSSGSDLSSLLGQMLPMMMMSGLMNPNKDLTNPNTAQSPQTAPPPAANQNQTQPQPQPNTAQPSTAPNGTSSTQPPLPPQGRTPGSDGSVLYTFDDGRTQKVSAVVAQALDAARANKDGTDAQAAYAKTSAKWSDNKQIGDAVDPSQLMTGDVATWDNHTAIVVVFPPGQNGGTGSLEVIAQGKLQPFAPQMSDKSGDFGDFAGFEHPHGIEMTDTSDPTAGTGGVVPAADPSAAPAATASAVPTS